MSAHVEWFTTGINPRAPRRDYDGQQRGWRLHAVNVTQEEVSANIPFGAIRERRALCGLQPRHGWGLDFWIEDKCVRCEKILQRASVVLAVDPSWSTPNSDF
jgi:hypothetical protein